MMDVDIYSFKLGNVVELKPLCQMLGEENMKLVVTERLKTCVKFDVTYFGVLLGHAVFDALGGWTWEPI